jgi:ADP-heptose:LPS heptosyltransferase
MKIILCPGSAENQKFKRWPAKKFYILAKLFLNSQYDVSIVLGPEEGYLEKEFGDIKIIKSPSFKDLKILGSLSNLIICNDSFLLHFSLLLMQMFWHYMDRQTPLEHCL